MQCTYWIKNNKVGPMQQIKSVKNIIKHNMLSVVKEIIKLNKTKKKNHKYGFVMGYVHTHMLQCVIHWMIFIRENQGKGKPFHLGSSVASAKYANAQWMTRRLRILAWTTCGHVRKCYGSCGGSSHERRCIVMDRATQGYCARDVGPLGL